MLNIGIIGYGNIASRHIQGFEKAHHPFRLHVFDIRDSNFAGCITYADQKSLLRNGDLDFILNAGTSSARDEMFSEINLLTDFSTPLLIEKNFFSTANASLMLNQITQNTNVFCNCPVHLYPAIKQFQEGTDPIHIKIIGKNFGILCNTIHYLSFLQMSSLKPLRITRLNYEFVGPNISKRAGTDEFGGTVNIHLTDESTLEIDTRENTTSSTTISITSGNRYLAIIDDIIVNSSDNSQIGSQFSVYQSNLSDLYLKSFLSTKTFPLPGYSQLRLLTEDFISRINDNSDSNTYRLP